MAEETTWRPRIIENPLAIAVRSTVAMYEPLDFSPQMFIPSIVSAIVLTVVLALEIVLWPYGLIPVIAGFMWSFVCRSAEQIRQTRSYMQKMPFTVAAGIYFAMWLPFGLLCLPFVIIGGIGQWLAHRRSGEDSEDDAAEDAIRPHETGTSRSIGTHPMSDADIAGLDSGGGDSGTSSSESESVVGVGWEKT